MLRKLTIFATLLAMLVVASVPVLAQGSGEESPFEPFLGGPDGDDLFISGDQAINCGSVFAPTPQLRSPFEEISSPVQTSPEIVEEARRLCLENGYVPPSGTGPTDTGTIQYDNANIASCFERQPDGFCSGYIGPDGGINQAQPAY